MNKKQLILILTVITTIITLSTVVSATNLKDMQFNVSSEFKLNSSDIDSLHFEDANGNSFFISEKELGNLDSKYKKYNETTYIFNESYGGEDIEVNGRVIDKMPVKQMFSYGEYIKINGKTYKVYIMGDSHNPDNDKCLEHLNYFNEHNKVELVKIF